MIKTLFLLWINNYNRCIIQISQVVELKMLNPSIKSSKVSSFASTSSESLFIPFWMRGLAGIMFLFIIPLEFLIKNNLSENEDSIIHWIQKSRSSQLDFFFKAVSFTANEKILIVALPCLFNLIDPVKTFKITIVSCHSMYLYSFVGVLFTEPRPYWIHTDIDGVNCEAGYGAPCKELVFSMIFYLYIIIELFQRPRHQLRSYLYVIASLYICLVGYSELYLGENFIHQIVLTLSVAYVYLILVLATDVYIQRISLNSSFFTPRNRKGKIYWLIASLCLILVVMILRINVDKNGSFSIVWIKNAYNQCQFDKDISGIYSVFETGWMFYNYGAVWGALDTSKKLRLGWWRTNYWIRLLRGILTSIIACGIYYGFNQIQTFDDFTQFTFNYSLPLFICAYLSFGIMPIVFDKIHLTNKDYVEEAISSISSNKEQANESFSSGISMNPYDS